MTDVAAPAPIGPYIDGEIVRSTSESVTMIDPSTGAPAAVAPSGSQEDVDRAVAAARRSFEDGGWSETGPLRRKAVLHEFAALIAADAAALDALDAREMGKPVSTTLGSAAGTAALVRFAAEAVDKVTGDVFLSDPHSVVVQRRLPRGVIGAIVPFNFPTFAAAIKFAPALAAGNSVVLKPSEYSPSSALRLAQLAVAAGVPAGVLNVVPGLGQVVGKALGLHMEVDMLTFTGSTAVGKKMMEYSGRSNLKPVLAECGGKSPHIVFADGVDLEDAGTSIARMLLINQGQLCVVGSRLLVERSIEPALVEIIAAKLGQITPGPAIDPATTFGPLASETQFARVKAFIDGARGGGAQLVAGGAELMRDSGGFFIAPTVFRQVEPHSLLAQEEVFGPVLAVTTFDSEEEAVALANSTRYGLKAYVWTADFSKALRMMKRIRTSISLNGASQRGEGAGNAGSSEPHGESGLGVEGGLAGLQSYLRRQQVTMCHS